MGIHHIPCDSKLFALDSVHDFGHFVIQPRRTRIHPKIQRVLDQSVLRCCCACVNVHQISLRSAGAKKERISG